MGDFDQVLAIIDRGPQPASTIAGEDVEPF
jgi:hypothetical protein